MLGLKQDNPISQGKTVDTEEITRTFRLLLASNGILELRILNGKQIIAGYYDAEHYDLV